MPDWLEIAEGPLGRFALALFVLGSLRLVAITAWDMVMAVRKAGDKRIPYRRILSATVSWLVPFKRIFRAKQWFTYASFGFHIGILLVGLFLSHHISTFQSLTHLSWPSIAKPALDALTLVGILGGLGVLFFRIYAPDSRKLSGVMDYLLLILILGLFLSGYVAGRPWNPIPYNQLMLFHVLAGVVIVATIPFTKIAHCVLFPFVRLGSEIAWHFQPDAGQKVVGRIHGSEGRKV